MPDAPAIRAAIGLPPEQTVRAFEARDDLRATVRWSEMWHEDHARAFTVAKVAKLDLLAEIQASLADMLANGGTFEQWKDNLVPHLKAQGWWGDVTDRTVTGTDELVKVGPRRLRTIYDTNLRVSRAAGRWARIQELKGARPFLRYTAVLDARTRPEHRRWHGIILPVDHPWWDTHFPPCGWHCRCTVRQLSQRELDAKGWKISNVPDDGPPREFFPAGSTEAVMVPVGIAPGFAYNAGKASFAPIVDKAIRTAERVAPTDLAAARETIEAIVRSEVLPQVLKEPGQRFPLMVVDDEVQRFGGAPSPVTTFSHEQLADQTAMGRETALSTYREIAGFPASAEVIASRREGSMTMAGRSGDSWLTATFAGSELTVVERLSQAQLDKRLLRAAILRDDTVDLARGLPALIAAEGEERSLVVVFGRAGAESPEDVRGFRRELGSSELWHAVNKHRHDALPLSASDFLRVDEIIARGRLFDERFKDRRQQVWMLEKGGVFWFYVERVSARNGRLIGRTMYRTATPNPKYLAGGSEVQ